MYTQSGDLTTEQISLVEEHLKYVYRINGRRGIDSIPSHKEMVQDALLKTLKDKITFTVVPSLERPDEFTIEARLSLQMIHSEQLATAQNDAQALFWEQQTLKAQLARYKARVQSLESKQPWYKKLLAYLRTRKENDD